jgi:hypothetical protein
VRNRKSITAIVVWALLFALATERPAFANIDAGSASMVTQLFVAGGAGLVVAVKFSWKRLNAFLLRRKP